MGSAARSSAFQPCVTPFLARRRRPARPPRSRIFTPGIVCLTRHHRVFHPPRSSLLPTVIGFFTHRRPPTVAQNPATAPQDAADGPAEFRHRSSASPRRPLTDRCRAVPFDPRHTRRTPRFRGCSVSHPDQGRSYRGVISTVSTAARSLLPPVRAPMPNLPLAAGKVKPGMARLLKMVAALNFTVRPVATS